jgi:dihydrofolate reductase
MRKLIIEEWISLDGFVADKNNGLDFFTNLTSEENKYSDADQLKFLDSIDTILLGRKTYELFVKFWPTATTEQEVIADKLNGKPKIVFSNTINKAPWGNWPDALVKGGDAAKTIKELKAKEGKDMVVWGSISLVQSLMKENLVDEFHFQLCPIILGGGRELFSEPRNTTQLALKEIRKYDTGTIFLSYVYHGRH